MAEADPRLAEGAALMAQGRAADAETIYQAVLAESPDSADAYFLWGILALQAGDATAGVERLTQACALSPNNPQFQRQRGQVLMQLGRADLAAESLGAAHFLAPGDAEAAFEFGEALRLQGKDAEAEPVLRRAFDLRPDFAAAGNSLGVVLDRSRRPAEAEAVYRQIIATAGVTPELLYNLGNVCKDQRHVAEAADAYAQAVALRPDYPEAQVHLAYAKLFLGDYATAWDAYEWRWKLPQFADTVRDYPQPRWTGEALDGKRILVWSEQGFGDTLQFGRFASEVAARGGEVILECQPPLAELMSSLPGVAEAVAYGGGQDFDVHVPLLSLPGILGIAEATIPAAFPYLSADPARIEDWRRRIGGPEGRKIGLAWRGSAEVRGTTPRACPLEALAPLLALDGVSVFGFQKDKAPEDLALPEGLTDLADDFADFSDTAAAMMAMDAVVTIDTAVSHLALALGRPTWVMLSRAADWRWGREGPTTPWYPAAHLVRQEQAGEWAAVIDRVVRGVAGSLPTVPADGKS